MSSTKLYSAEEVAQHKTEQSCWISVHGHVYDVTGFLDDHPGGPDIIMNNGGTDATEEFEDVFHSKTAREQLGPLRIGKLEGYEGPDDAHMTGEGGATDPPATSPFVYIIPVVILLITAYIKFA
eukprot:CAMPEP_0205825192 /NCGR_PEP_ID=MMETSP0206-20130828/24257_1 /ASSEMBLY_ACC=CAM_ASM_000279 /TAXON_ID=36767 /ORGANISM="Euplotes focardii, Strain TN1" /LENGTH=123 /DNA_ID=CAMNT_0053124023 /DNA_START=46 /DNA_END=417 /DNA_ORIENTATION=+